MIVVGRRIFLLGHCFHVLEEKAYGGMGINVNYWHDFIFVEVEKFAYQKGSRKVSLQIFFYLSGFKVYLCPCNFLYLFFPADSFIWSSSNFSSSGVGKLSLWFWVLCITPSWSTSNDLGNNNKVSYENLSVVWSDKGKILSEYNIIFRPRPPSSLFLFNFFSIFWRKVDFVLDFSLRKDGIKMWFIIFVLSVIELFQALQPLLERLLRSGLERFATFAKSY